MEMPEQTFALFSPLVRRNIARVSDVIKCGVRPVQFLPWGNMAGHWLTGESPYRSNL
jgi:hypothetical protein